MTLIKLPSGLLDGPDHFKFAEVDELLGKHQNYLANKELVVGNIGHIPKILSEVVKSLQTAEGLKWQGKMEDAINKLPAGDLETILINIRLNTYGPRFYFQAECPHCKELNKNLRVDLDKLDITEMSVEELLNPKKVMLPKCGLEVELKPIYLEDLFKVIKLANSGNDKLITSLAAVTIKKLGDKYKITSEDLDDIPASDLNLLQDEITKLKLDGEIDSKVQIDCQHCKKEFEQKLQVFDASFFYPTKD